MGCSSMAEQRAVNSKVVGSNPATPANKVKWRWEMREKNKSKIVFASFLFALFLQIFATSVVVMLSLNADGVLKILGFAVATLSVIAFIVRSYKLFAK